MPPSLFSDMILQFGLTTQDLGTQADSRSGAVVNRVRTASGRPAYLKTTPAELGHDALTAARRELRFYRELADRVSFRTPDLLACHDTETGVALLLAATGRALPPWSWPPARWAALGGQLALVHSTQPPPGRDWRRPDPLMDAVAGPDIEHGTAYWAASVPELARVLAHTGDLLSHLSALPLVFSHGDCHTGNVLCHENQLALCDWQMTGIGRPSADLAFLSVRATPSGVVVPPDLITAYRDRLACDHRTLGRAVMAEELATFLFLWPAFAHLNTAAGIAHVRRRVRSLASMWLRDLMP